MNRKNMPLLLMLIAGACTWIVTLVTSYSLLGSLVGVLTVMVLFFCLRSENGLFLDRIDRQNEEKAKQEQEEKEKALQEEEAAGSQEDTAQKGVSDSNG